MSQLELDAGCEPGLPRSPDVLEEHVPWLVLFASVMDGTRDDVERHAAEWRALFGQGEPWHVTRG